MSLSVVTAPHSAFIIPGCAMEPMTAEITPTRGTVRVTLTIALRLLALQLEEARFH